MASFTSDKLLDTLYYRLMDPNKDQFGDTQLLLELNNAQEELINRLLPRFMNALEVKDELVSLDGNGEFDIEDLDNVPIDGVNSIQKVLWYHKDPITLDRTTEPARELNEDELNKLYNNNFYSVSNDEPKYLIQGSKVKLFAGLLSITTASSSAGVTIVAAVTGESYDSGGPLVGTDDYYNGFYLRSSKGNDYKISDYAYRFTIPAIQADDDEISDYLGTAYRFTIPAIQADDDGETNWKLLTPYKDNYCGSVLVSYQRQPLEMTDSIDCELQNKYRTIILLLAESYVWASDGKSESSDRAYQKAMNQINMINGTIKPTDNVGYRAKKY